MRSIWLAGACLVVGFVGLTSARQNLPKVATNADRSVSQKQLEAAKRQGLHEAAKLAGSFVSEDRYPSAGAPISLEEVAAVSDAIIVGAPRYNKCRLAGDGRSVSTVYQVQPDLILKGNPVRGSDGLISVSLKGGKVKFSDGTTAEQFVSGFYRPRDGSSFVWFIRKLSVQADPEDTVYELALGAFGLWDISGQRASYTLPTGEYLSSLSRKIRRAEYSPSAFVGFVRHSASR